MSLWKRPSTETGEQALIRVMMGLLALHQSIIMGRELRTRQSDFCHFHFPKKLLFQLSSLLNHHRTIEGNHLMISGPVKPWKGPSVIVKRHPKQMSSTLASWLADHIWIVSNHWEARLCIPNQPLASLPTMVIQTHNIEELFSKSKITGDTMKSKRKYGC